jgi:hypothetical protein
MGRLSRLVQWGLVAGLALVPVGGCGLSPSGFGGAWLGSGDSGTSLGAANESTGTVPAVPPSRRSIAASEPIDAYVALGGRIKTCWFNAVNPLLPNHVYRADVSPSGSKVEITIHQRLLLGRPGVATYAIDFRQEGTSTTVTATNLMMPPDLAAKMQYDIDRWRRGDTNCNKVMPRTAAAYGAH